MLEFVAVLYGAFWCDLRSTGQDARVLPHCSQLICAGILTGTWNLMLTVD
jgi:hypothetical protein